MKILLIRPKPHKETIGLQSVMICEPLELMTLKSVLTANGHNIEIIDMILEKKSLLFFIKKYNPEIVGFTGYISHIGVIKEYARIAKEYNSEIKIVVGGVHAEVYPKDFQDNNIDKICSSAQDMYNFLNCKDKTPRLPDRNLPEKYRKAYYYLFHKNCALIKTSFGCPYNCDFCFCKEVAPYSAREIDDVIKELLTIEQKEVYIVDDDFLFNRKRLLEFAEKLEKNNIKKRYLVYGRADFIANNEDIIKRLKENGLRAVIVGLEAANQEELDNFNKKTKISDNIQAVKILQKYDIECYGTVILGMDWDKSNFKRLYEFLSKLNLVFVNLQPLTPMPCTKIYDEYKEKFIIPYKEHEKWDMAHLVLQPEKLTVREFYFQILKLYYLLSLNPKSALYMIKKYGLCETLKLSIGAMHVALQYINKIIRG